MGELIEFMLNTLGGGGVIGAGPEGGSFSDLGKSLPQYQGSLWDTVVTIHDVAVKPITAVVLAIMFTLSLARTASQVDGDSQLGVRIVAATMFKVALVFIVAQNAMNIFGAIVSISTDITRAIITDPQTPGRDIGTQIKDQIDGMNPIEQVGAVILLLLPFIIAMAAALIPFVLIYVRFLTLYILAAFVSLPLAFLGHEDTKQISIGYLKAIAVAALSGSVLVLAAKLFAATNMSGFGDFNGEVLPFITGNFWNMLLAPLVFLFVMLTANGLAKKLVGDG